MEAEDVGVLRQAVVHVTRAFSREPTILMRFVIDVLAVVTLHRDFFMCLMHNLCHRDYDLKSTSLEHDIESRGYGISVRNPSSPSELSNDNTSHDTNDEYQHSSASRSSWKMRAWKVDTSLCPISHHIRLLSLLSKSSTVLFPELVVDLITNATSSLADMFSESIFSPASNENTHLLCLLPGVSARISTFFLCFACDLFGLVQRSTVNAFRFISSGLLAPMTRIAEEELITCVSPAMHAVNVERSTPSPSRNDAEECILNDTENRSFSPDLSKRFSFLHMNEDSNGRWNSDIDYLLSLSGLDRVILEKDHLTMEDWVMGIGMRELTKDVSLSVEECWTGFRRLSVAILSEMFRVHVCERDLKRFFRKMFLRIESVPMSALQFLVDSVRSCKSERLDSRFMSIPPPHLRSVPEYPTIFLPFTRLGIGMLKRSWASLTPSFVSPYTAASGMRRASKQVGDSSLRARHLSFDDFPEESTREDDLESVEVIRLHPSFSPSKIPSLTTLSPSDDESGVESSSHILDSSAFESSVLKNRRPSSSSSLSTESGFMWYESEEDIPSALTNSSFTMLESFQDVDFVDPISTSSTSLPDTVHFTRYDMTDTSSVISFDEEMDPFPLRSTIPTSSHAEFSLIDPVSHLFPSNAELNRFPLSNSLYQGSNVSSWSQEPEVAIYENLLPPSTISGLTSPSRRDAVSSFPRSRGMSLSEFHTFRCYFSIVFFTFSKFHYP